VRGEKERKKESEAKREKEVRKEREVKRSTTSTTTHKHEKKREDEKKREAKKKKFQHREAVGLPHNTSQLAAPKEPRCTEVLQDADGRITIPRQNNVASGPPPEPPPRPRTGADWTSIDHKSRTLFSLPLEQVHNRTLRRLIAYAKKYHADLSTAQRYAAKSVVYVVFHIRSSMFYVGETKFDGRKRLMEHWHSRGSTKGSALSSHMAKFTKNCVDGWSEYRVFPVHVYVEESNRKRFEANTISDLRRGRFQSRCINVVPHVLGKRLRHRPNPPPVGAPAGSATVQVRTHHHGAAAHLSRLNDKNRFAELEKMKDSTLSALKRIVSHEAPMGRQIREVAEKRRKQLNRDKSAGLRFVITFASRKMQAIDVRQELRRNMRDWPFDRKLLDTLRVVYKPLAPRNFRNHVDVSLHAFDLPTSCNCSSMSEEFKIGGHVLTADPQVFLPLLDERERDAIRWLVAEAGPKFRTDLGHLKVLACVRNDLESFMRAVEASETAEGVDSDARKKWLDSMFNSFASALYSKSPSVPSPVGKMNINAVMRKVHEQFVLAPADKNAQNTAIWCKALYRQSIESHLSPPVFEEVTGVMTYEGVMDAHQTFAKAYGKDAYDTLPYVYKLAKIHKLEQNPDRPPSRPIAGKSVKNKPGEPSEHRGVNSLSAVHRQAAKMLQSVMDLLIMRDRRSAVRFCWFVRTAQEVVDTLCSDKSIEEFETSDFSDMYTNIPLDDLVKELHGAIDIAADELAQLFSVTTEQASSSLRYTPGGKWEKPPGGRAVPKSHWSMQTLKRVVEQLVYATYVRVGDRLFRQAQGIGMGQESSPPMAQLYLHMKERRWINRLIGTFGPEHIERRYNNFRSFVRMMDDNLFPIKRSDREYGVLPEKEDYGGLEFKVTGEGNRVKFIGLEFHTQRHGTQGNFVHEVSAKAFDKQKSFAFTLIRYPSWHSNVPKHIITGSVIGLLCRVFTHTSKTSDFIEHAVDGLKRVSRLRGYPVQAVTSGIVKFLRRNIEQNQITMVRDALFAAVKPDASGPHIAAPPPVSTDAGRALQPLVSSSRSDEHSGPHQPRSAREVEDVPAAERQLRSATPVVVEFSLPQSEEDPVSATLRATPPTISVNGSRAPSRTPRRQSPHPASSTEDDSKRSTTPAFDLDYERIERSVERTIRELLPPEALRATDQAQLVSETLQTVRSLCDAITDQQKHQAQLVSDVLAHRHEHQQPPQQRDDLPALVADFRQEARAVMDCAVSAIKGVAHMMIEQNTSACAASGRLVELVESRLSQAPPVPVQQPTPALPPTPPPPLQIDFRFAAPQIVELPAPVVTVQQQASSEALLASIMEMMSHNFNYQRQILEHTQQTMLAMTDTSREVSKQLVESSVASQQLLLTNFTTAVDKAMSAQSQPLAQLCPVLRQCITSLAATRGALSSVSRPRIMSHHGVTAVEVRDKSASPSVSASRRAQTPNAGPSEAASGAPPSDDGTTLETGKRARSPVGKTHRAEQPVAAVSQDPDRSPSPEPRDPSTTTL
jgi:hypothetical protein